MCCQKKITCICVCVCVCVCKSRSIHSYCTENGLRPTEHEWSEKSKWDSVQCLELLGGHQRSKCRFTLLSFSGFLVKHVLLCKQKHPELSALKAVAVSDSSMYEGISGIKETIDLKYLSLTLKILFFFCWHLLSVSSQSSKHTSLRGENKINNYVFTMKEKPSQDASPLTCSFPVPGAHPKFCDKFKGGLIQMKYPHT